MNKTITKSRAEQINQLHMECLASIRTGVQKAILMGQILIEQKRECGHGHWIPWVEANLDFSVKTAWQYMRCYYKQSQILPQSKISTITDIARVTAKPSKEELEEKAQRERELDDLAEIEAKKRIAAAAKEKEIAEEKSKIESEVIEMEIVEEDFDSEPAEPEESEEEFEKRVQGIIESTQEGESEYRKEQQLSEREIAKLFNKAWKIDVCGLEILEPIDKSRIAKIAIKVLYKKYPQLMDESIEE